MATRRAALALFGAAAFTPAIAWAGSASAAANPVTAWLNRHARPLSTLDPLGPLDDLCALDAVVGRAEVVGVGESAHGSRTEFAAKFRVTRYLVERLGFRTVAWEEDFASGVAIDRYVTGGDGDPAAIVGAANGIWRTEEMLAFVRWLRSYNAGRQRKVRFLGTDITQLRRLAFDEVTSYVEREAPDRAAELAVHTGAIDLDGRTPLEQLGWYVRQPEADKEGLRDHARAVVDLVRSLPDNTAPERPFAQRFAEAVDGWYRYYGDFQIRHRDLFMADTIDWWRGLGGGRTVYWASNPHATSAPSVTGYVPPSTITETLAGGLLRARHGDRYRAIATLFHSGRVLTGWTDGTPTPHEIPAPAAGTLGAVLGTARYADYLIDLHAPASGEVVEWLAAPSTSRLIPHEYDAAEDERYAMSVGELRTAFDAVVYLRVSEPTRLLG